MLEPAKFCRYRIIVRKAEYLCDIEIHIMERKLLLSENIGAVSIGYELEKFAGELLVLGKGHTHGQDTRSDIPGSGHLVAQDGLLECVHDEPDIMLDALDFDISLISCQIVGRFVIESIDKRLDKGCSSFSIIADRNMGDPDLMYLPQGSGGGSCGQAEVDMVSEAQAKDMR